MPQVLPIGLRPETALGEEEHTAADRMEAEKVKDQIMGGWDRINSRHSIHQHQSNQSWRCTQRDILAFCKRKYRLSDVVHTHMNYEIIRVGDLINVSK